MGLTRYTQEMFNNLPIISGYKRCPKGDYSAIYEFPERCFFDNECQFRYWSEFGNGCMFGSWCNFGECCNFHDGCHFNTCCRFGDQPIFGKHCVCEFGEFDKMISCGGFGRYDRTTYFFRLINGAIFVQCGCFQGDLQKWIDQVCETHKDTHLKTAYLALIPAVKAQFEED